MSEQLDREQEAMERWERRGRFFSLVIVGMFLRPAMSVLAFGVGLGAIVVMWTEGVVAWPPYAAALSLATSPGVVWAVETIRRPPPPPGE